MSVLLYTGKSTRLGGRLKRVIKTKVSGKEIESYTDMEGLARRLQQRVYDIDAAVLLLSTQCELDAILSRKESLWGLRVILVLPDEERETISKAHRLSPRFIGFMDKGFTDVAAVLAKMLEGADRLMKSEKRPLS